MNTLQRTIKEVIETNLLVSADKIMRHASGKKLFQLVKHVTGSIVSTANDYQVTEYKQYQGYDSVILAGKLGYIRVTLEPLFQVIE